MNLARETTASPRRGVPLWAQILIWGFLVSFLVLIGIGVSRAQQGNVQPGYEVPDFSLSLFSGYEYNGQSEVKLSELRARQGSLHQFLGIVVQALRTRSRGTRGGMEILSAQRKGSFPGSGLCGYRARGAHLSQKIWQHLSQRPRYWNAHFTDVPHSRRA